jgi:hypothetical protein
MRSWIIALFTAGLISAPASAQSFVGEWRATAETPGGQISEALSVKKTADGYSITATPVTELPPGQPNAGPGVEIELEGDSFSYKRVVSTAQADLEIVYSGVVSGDRFTGKADIGGFAVPYNGERVSPAD